MKLVFDFGGVVLRWRPRMLMRAALPERAVDDASADAVAQAIFQGFGGEWAEFDRGRIAVPELVQAIAQRTGLAPQEVAAVVQAVPAELQPLPDTVALIERLSAAGHALYFLSNMPAPYAEHIERSHGFMRHFRDGIFSAREGLIKPEPAIFELACVRFGHAPGELLFLDDHAGNVAAARALGWQAHHFSTAALAEHELRERGLLQV